MTKKEFIVFGRPDITKAENNAVNEVLDSKWLSTGDVCHQFEKEFQEFIGAGNAVSVNSCTMGLILSLKALDIGPGDEVILPTLTFCATLNAVLAVGANPVLVDVDTIGHIDPKEIEKVITKSTKAIIPVHYTGSSCNMSAIKYLADKHGIKVIEDAAHAFGGRDKEGNRIGSLSDFASFSFYATKNITCGEGGIVMVRDKKMADKVRMLSMNGLSLDAWNRYGNSPVKTYQISQAGLKGNLSDIQAAIGRTQLKRWPFMKIKRDNIWRIYEQAFGKREKGHSTHLFTILADDRDYLRKFMFEKGIGTGIHFNPLHLEPAYKFLGYMRNDFPFAELIGDHTVSLPVSSTMTEKDADRVLEAISSSRATILNEERHAKKGEKK